MKDRTICRANVKLLWGIRDAGITEAREIRRTWQLEVQLGCVTDQYQPAEKLPPDVIGIKVEAKAGDEENPERERRSCPIRGLEL